MPDPRESGENVFFFSHVEYKYFPCHKTDYPEDFICQFCCYPLYTLSKDRGSNFSFDAKSPKRLFIKFLLLES
ncbi:MAG: cysteine-rich small domain-containing protein [Bacillota bacterium]